MVKKSLTVQLLILIIALAVIIPLALSANNTSVTKYHQAIDSNNASRCIRFDLRSGQTVNGSVVYYSEVNGNWFAIYDSDDEPLIANSVSITQEQNQGTYKFTANNDGAYFLGISDHDVFVKYLDYSYTVSPAPILGLDPVVLIGLVIAAGAILEVAIFFRYRAKSEKT
jgi:hypothetical protein